MAAISPSIPAAEPAPKPKKKRTLRNGIVLLTVAVVAGVGLLVTGLLAMPDIGAFPRATGEQQAVDLTAGTWTVFAEGSGVPPAEIVGPDEQIVPIESSSVNANYNYGGRRGYSIGKVSIPETGSYLVTNGPGGTTAFAQSFGSDLTKAILVIVAGSILGLVLGGAGLVLVVLGLSQRRNASISGPI